LGLASRATIKTLQVVQSYYQLTKPRIIPLLLLITTAGSGLQLRDGRSAVAAGNLVAELLLLLPQTLNCIYDRDIDYEMERTRDRRLDGCSRVMLLRSPWQHSRLLC